MGPADAAKDRPAGPIAASRDRPSAMRVAVVQMCSTDDLEANLAVAEGFVREAAGAGAELVALPEMFAYMRREGGAFPCAQTLEDEIVSRARGWARQHGLRLLAGSFPERSEGDRVFNTSVLIGPGGELEGVYRKLHLFDVDLGAEGGGRFQESASIAAGDGVVVAETPFGGVGLSVCYDLRFPELYRLQAERDAVLVAVPSAFTPQTGKDHWEVLLRARAIENQVFVLAPAQCGRHGPDRASHGRSLLIDPWGVVLAQLGDRPGLALADCDLALQARMRERLPVLRHRRL
jgi:predicted amidohydrolase